MQLATDSNNFADGALGLVELAASFLNDRTKSRWSKAELIEYANHEQQRLANLINSYYESYFVTSATAPTVANQSYYSLPSDLVQIMGVELGDTTNDLEPQPLTEVHYTDRDFYQRLSATNQKSEMGFFFIVGNSLRLAPATTVAGQQIRIFYVERLDPLVNNTDVSRIPLEHHELLALGMARRARVKLGRENPEITRMYQEGVATLRETIAKFSPQREETVEPWSPDMLPIRPDGHYAF